MALDTGYPHADAQTDFQRQRRRQVLAQLASRLRREPDDVSDVLPYQEVVDALGYAGEGPRGLQAIPLDAIVGSVDRAADFDRQFRPKARVSRERWERLDRLQRQGEALPPIEVYQVGDRYFVKDGHHRVSVAHALRLRTIDAYVTEVRTTVDAAGIAHRSDLIAKDLRRVFLDRVPLNGPALSSILVTSAWSLAVLSETVEAWGFRLMQQENRYLDRPTVAKRWYAEEYQPVVRMLAAADLIGDRTDAEAYLDLACQRYQLMRTHRWDEQVVAALREARAQGEH